MDGAADRPVDPHVDLASRATARGAGEGGGEGKHRILENRVWILTEGCLGVSASPEHNAAAARHRLRVNFGRNVKRENNENESAPVVSWFDFARLPK